MSKNISACFSSKSDEWETPKNLFDELDLEFNFDIDLCANSTNHLCDNYFTKDTFDLLKVCSLKNKSIYCNPPYSKVGFFVEICSLLGLTNDVCMLVPSRTDTKWFHDFIYSDGTCVYKFIRGRIKFCKDSIPQSSAPFPSMLVMWFGKSAILRKKQYEN